MNTINVQQQTLPPIIKQSATYKMFVPKKVEAKIRYLIRKFPSTEWSGVLFYKYTGSFETNDLEIHCEDFYPMDLGTGGWTEFKMTEDVTGYIVENMDLFSCETGLIHSHHILGAFFSGQDIKTLNIEGNDTNCFVSLIVDTKGTYQAAITRKVQSKKQITTEYLGSSYEFFGEGAKQVTGADLGREEEVETTAIEYFMLDVQREVVDNPYDFLDARFEEIETKKKAVLSQKSFSDVNNKSCIEDKSFQDWLDAKELGAKEYKFNNQPTLFDEQTMEDILAVPDWYPDPTIIHYLCCQLLTCALIVNKDIDLGQWTSTRMEKKYNEIFGEVDDSEFSMWADSYVEFIVNHYKDSLIPPEISDYSDLLQSKVAQALIAELDEYESNKFIDKYIDILTRYIVY